MAGCDNLLAHFPDEILIEIFLRLPVRPLFLFRSVCKHWLHLIESPDFIRLHINRSIDNHIDHNPLLILRTVMSDLEPIAKRHVLTLLSDDETLPYEIDVPLDLISHSFASRDLGCGVYLLGPCNGLFCITDTIDVVMFNPATRQCRQLPRTTLTPRFHRAGENSFGLFQCVAFGFDPVSNDYKVVRFDFDDKPHINNPEDNDDIYFHDYDHYYKVEIFSLSTDCWRELGRLGPAGRMITFPTYNLFIDGAFHWISGDYYEVHSILVFDLNKEAIKMFELPAIYDHDRDVYVYLSVLNESLAVVAHTNINNYEDEIFEIWVMREYGVHESWSKLYNVNPTIDIARPLSFGKDGELFIEDSDAQLASFDFRAMPMKKSLVSRVRRSVQRSMYAFRYRESLISLRRC